MKLQIIARERDERKRAEFRRFTSQFQPEQFLFVDESSKDERTTQVRCEYSIRHRNNAVVSETSAWGQARFGGGVLASVQYMCGAKLKVPLGEIVQSQIITVR